MKKRLALAVTLAFAGVLCFALPGCSSGESGADAGDAAPAAEEPAADPVANVSPDEIDPGHVVGNEDRTSDIWWKDGQAGTEGIYNIEIMEERQSIAAFGAGGVSKVYTPAENRIERVPNVKGIEQYISRIDEMIQRKKEGFCQHDG